MFNINLKHPAFTEKQYNCPVIQTHSSLYPLSGIWQELLGPHHGGISSQKVADFICSEKRTAFRERSSRKIVSFEEQIMSKDKYNSDKRAYFRHKWRLSCFLSF